MSQAEGTVCAKALSGGMTIASWRSRRDAGVAEAKRKQEGRAVEGAGARLCRSPGPWFLRLPCVLQVMGV